MAALNAGGDAVAEQIAKVMRDSGMADYAAGPPVTMEMLNTAEYKFNGPEEVGIAAAAEPAMKLEDRVTFDLKDSAPVRAACAFLSAQAPVGCHEKIAKMYRIAAGWVAYGVWAAESDVNKAAAKVVSDSLAAPVVKKILEEMNGDLMHPSLLMLFAPIVTWWMTNHHTGGAELNGFVRKAARLHVTSDGDLNEPTTAAIWRMGHWVHKPTLFSAAHWALAGGKSAGDFKTHIPIPGMSADVRLRMEGPPAGVHRLTTVKAVFDRIRSSNYRAIVNVPSDIKKIYENAAMVKRYGCRCHVGGKYLTGLEIMRPEEPSEEAMIIASAFAHSALAGTTLSRAKVLLPVSEINATALYGNVNSLKLASVTQKLTTEEIREILGKHGTLGRNFANVAFFTADEAADWKQEVDDLSHELRVLDAIRVEARTPVQIDRREAILARVAEINAAISTGVILA